MTELSTQLVNGLTFGAQYALIAAGLALIFGVLEIVNFAHGEFFMVGAYALYVATVVWDLPYAVAALVTVIGMGVFGVIFYYLIIARILNRGWQVQLVATLAASIVLTNLLIVVAGSQPKVVITSLTTDGIELFGVFLSWQRLLVLATTAVTFTVLALFLSRTKTGKSMRAVAQNRSAARIVGIDIARVGLVAVVLASALSGIAAATIAPLYSVAPTMGLLVVMKAFAAVIIGGFGNVTGAVYAGFAIGIVEALSIGYISSNYADVIVFGLMIAVLLVRPAGVFGQAVRA